MFRTLRLLAFACTFLALVALGGHALARWCGRAGSWQLARQLLTEVRRGEALDARDDASRRYNAAKQAVTDEVIAGRLSLTEAAERFAECGDLLDGQDGVLARYKGPAGEQELCGNVIVWVEATLPRGSSELADVLAPLEAEYRQRFGAEPPRLGWGAPDSEAPADEVPEGGRDRL